MTGDPKHPVNKDEPGQHNNEVGENETSTDDSLDDSFKGPIMEAIEKELQKDSQDPKGPKGPKDDDDTSSNSRPKL